MGQLRRVLWRWDCSRTEDRLTIHCLKRWCGRTNLSVRFNKILHGSLIVWNKIHRSRQIKSDRQLTGWDLVPLFAWSQGHRSFLQNQVWLLCWGLICFFSGCFFRCKLPKTTKNWSIWEPLVPVSQFVPRGPSQRCRGRLGAAQLLPFQWPSLYPGKNVEKMVITHGDWGDFGGTLGNHFQTKPSSVFVARGSSKLPKSCNCH